MHSTLIQTLTINLEQMVHSETHRYCDNSKSQILHVIRRRKLELRY